MATITPGTFKNWPNDWQIAWSKNSDVFGHENQIIFFFLPWIILLFVYLFRKKISGINENFKKYSYNVMGAFAIIWELWFDIASINSGTPAYQQFWNGFDLCRLNMYLIGVFLLFRKIDWIKWVVATALWGGTSTLFNHYNNAAPIHSLITHAIVLPTFPAIAITMAKTNYSFKSYVYAHLFNWSIVIFIVCLNYISGASHAELREDHLGDNVLVGWAPYGARMILWILVVMIVELCYFALYRYIYWQTYNEKDVKKTLFTKTVLGLELSFKTYKRKSSYSKDFKEDFRQSIKAIPYGPKNTYLAAKANTIKSYEFIVKSFGRRK